MRLAYYSAVVFLLLSTGCVRKTPETPQPDPTTAATAPETPPPVTSPAPVAKAPASTAKGTAAPPVDDTKDKAAPPVTTTKDKTTKDTPAPPVTATNSKTAPPATTTKGKTAAAPVTKAPATKPPAPKAQAPTQAAAPPASTAPPRQAAANPTLDLDALEAQLKATKAIGVFTKLSLKNQVDDLLDNFRAHHSGKATPTLTQLRQSYDLLMMKVLSLLQDHDQKLASDIVASREKIWGLLADPKKFAALQA